MSANSLPHSSTHHRAAIHGRGPRQAQGANLENPRDRREPALSDDSTPALVRNSSTLSATTAYISGVSLSPQLGSTANGRSPEPFEQNGDLVGVGAIWLGVDLDGVPEFAIEETGPGEDTAGKDRGSLHESNSSIPQFKLNPAAASFTPNIEVQSNPNLGQGQESLYIQPRQPSKARKGPGKRMNDTMRLQRRNARRFLWWIKFPPEIKNVQGDIEQPPRFRRANATFPLVATSAGILGPIRHFGYEEYFESYDDYKVYRSSLARALSTKLDRPVPRFMSPNPRLRVDVPGCRRAHRPAAVVYQEGVPVLISRSTFPGSERVTGFVERWRALKNALIPPAKRVWFEELFGWDPRLAGWGRR